MSHELCNQRFPPPKSCCRVHSLPRGRSSFSGPQVSTTSTDLSELQRAQAQRAAASLVRKRAAEADVEARMRVAQDRCAALQRELDTAGKVERSHAGLVDCVTL